MAIKKGNKKERLDTILVELGYFETKSQAQAAIMARNVKINGQILTKAGHQLVNDGTLKVEVESMPYVSRGGFKLEKALQTFQVNLDGRICLDAGASTGGFTDCMLQRGAKKVYAVDVGYGQLAWKLRNDERVVVIERTNIKNCLPEEIYKSETESERANFAVMDLSFISITKVLENLKKLMNPEQQEIIALIKPQFEAGREHVPKSGVVKDKEVHFNVIKNIVNFTCILELFPVDLTYSPIKGPAGNIEYLVHIKNSGETINDDFIKIVINKAYEQLN